MKRRSFLSIIAYSFLVINWSQTNKKNDYCYGSVTLLDGKKEELVDLAIGRTKATAENSSIVFYRRPTTATKKSDFIEYHVDLRKLKKITLDQEMPTGVYDDHEYVHVTIHSPTGQEVPCIIQKEYELIAKIKNTGWTVSYPLQKLSIVEVHACYDDQTADHQDHAPAQETAVLNLEKALEDLEKTAKKCGSNKNQLKNLMLDTKEVLATMKQDESERN